MLKKKLLLSLFVLATIFITSCSKEEYTSVPQPQVDLTNVPYAKLSEYQFFEGEMKFQTPKERVLPYLPVSELFTDYAKKKRFVYLPQNGQATVNEHFETIELPTGSVLIKTFYYENVLPENETKIIETRLMIRKENGWIFAHYIWNDAQTEAYLDMNGSQKNISWTNEQNVVQNINYQIPNEAQCLLCHAGMDQNAHPIGIKPQNLNFDYDYESGTKNQLEKWVEMGFINNANFNIPVDETPVNYHDETKSLGERARSYLDINCAHCHRENGTSSQFVMRFSYHLTDEPANLGMCIPASHEVDGFVGRIITPGYPQNSMIINRISTNDFFYRMPSVGRTIVHEEGRQLLEDWISSLTDCE